MALCPTAYLFKGLSRVPKRGYAVQATVKKITLDPTRPIGDLPYLFTKQGQKIRELQREISLRALVDSTTSTQVALANGGDEGLANLEAAQKIAASPSLLAQFKKDKEVAQKALVGAVAWLKDLRTAQDAEEAAAKLDANTQALLNREVSFKEVVPIKNSCGLSIDLTQRATVQDWWVAYEAAKHLRAQKKTFSTISSVSLTPELENVLHEASVVRVRQQTLESVRAIAASVTLPAPNQIMAASELISPRAFNGSAVSSSLTSIKRWIEEAASISPTASTMGEIVTLALKIRSEVVALVSTLCAEAHARQLTYEESLYSAQWDTIMSGSADKAAVESAAKQIAAAPPKEPGTTQIPVEELLKKHLSTEYDAVEDALRSLSKVLESLPRDLYQQHLNQRLDLINRYAPAL